MSSQALFALATAILVCFAGCPTISAPESLESAVHANSTASSSTIDPTSIDQLRERIDKVLEFNLKNRRLAPDAQAGWQIFHGILAYGNDFEIRSGNQSVRAMDYIFRGGAIPGFVIRSGDRFIPAEKTADNPARGLGVRAEMDPGTKLGQGHRDQWLAYMASCSLPEDQEFPTMDGPRHLDMWLRQAEWDIPLNFEREYSWTLMALLPYRNTSHTWQARDGRQYSIASLLESEVNQLSPSSACGGSHRLVAIAMTLNKRKAEGAAITGPWQMADELVELAIEQAFEFQNADGSFSSNYFDRPGWSLDVGSAIGTTGHTLEFVAHAGDDVLITADETIAAANCLCGMLEKTQTLDVECGALYHALAGLRVYRERLTQQIKETPVNRTTNIQNSYRFRSLSQLSR